MSTTPDLSEQRQEASSTDDAGNAAGETKPEWIVYQIGCAEPNKYRFIVTRGFQDVAVTGTLKPFEFIDSTTTLLGEFGGDVTVLNYDAMLDVLNDADRLLGYFHWDSSTGRTDKFELVQKIRSAIAAAR